MATGQKAQVRSGRCLCGAVRYTVRGPLRGIIVCHCGQCRRQHSYLSAFTSAARADVSLEGADGVRWFAASARGRRGFCAACGSSLFFEPAGEARLAIAAGSLDQPSGLEIIGHEYVADQADYERTDQGRPAYPGDFGAQAEEKL
jgi:hypothetical protein